MNAASRFPARSNPECPISLDPELLIATSVYKDAMEHIEQLEAGSRVLMPAPRPATIAWSHAESVVSV